ncbi:hypothetical protein K5I29_07555 [Flavobacterium agricola]|uniref:Prolyl-tRNA synthetase n=1 Tax=Flavobacterium agricola TaxID=2870839 RepID=A0ABY6LXZ5_9FLAO|nr:hypothetical protein [Flavobacterium agricola]UYW00417.1 hypothetical protein K5I29_07555 [Flavobacterium agricola]
MQKIYFNKRKIGFAALLLGGIGLLSSCASYQNNSYYDQDGIYNSNPESSYGQRIRVQSTQTHDPNYDYNKYQDYFAEGKGDFTVFTDTDNFSSENPTTAAYNNAGYVDYSQNETFAERYGSFGQNSSSVTVNFYNNGYGYDPYWGNYYGGYYGSYWGWRRPYVGLYFGSPYYYNNWYGPSWGWNYGYGYGYGPGYYGGYYNPGYYGGYYAPARPVVRGQGQRNGVVRNNAYAPNNTSGNRIGVIRNSSNNNVSGRPNNPSSGTRPVNTNNNGVNRVPTDRLNNGNRQAILRDPSNINRAAVHERAASARNNNTIRNNSNGAINRPSAPVRNNNFNNNRGSNNAIQRTPSNNNFNRSAAPSRPSMSAPSRGSMGGGARGGSSGSVRR